MYACLVALCALRDALLVSSSLTILLQVILSSRFIFNLRAALDSSECDVHIIQDRKGQGDLYRETVTTRSKEELDDDLDDCAPVIYIGPVGSGKPPV